MSERRIFWWAAVASLWTFIAWGNRIGLLTGDEASDPWTWIRVGGSLLFGLALAGIAVLLRRGRPLTAWMTRVFIGFGVLMLIIWIRSSASVLSGDESVAFKSVHIALALTSIGLGIVLAGLATRSRRGRTNVRSGR
ncbi:MAG: hypothetical protein P1T08_06650 [Acidimicrobiia bacterium]|nr:hypothetical protein [Acidimicrobiia bacterium]